MQSRRVVVVVCPMNNVYTKQSTRSYIHDFLVGLPVFLLRLASERGRHFHDWFLYRSLCNIALQLDNNWKKITYSL